MKEKVRKMRELEQLIQQGFNDARVQKLRTELGLVLADSESLLEKQYLRLRAFDLTEREIAFALGVSSRTIAEMKSAYNNDELEEKLESYATHRLVVNYKRQRKRRWKYSL